MMVKKDINIKAKNIFLFVPMIFVCLLMKTSISYAETFIVSMGDLGVSNRDRIVGFQLKVIAGRIDSLLIVPIGWNINVDNDPSWQAKITGSSVVGASALSTDSLKKFVTIEKYEFMDLKFDIEADVIVREDFEKERTIHLKMKDFVLHETRKAK